MAISCKQCGRKTFQMCSRNPCWATETNIAMETARRAKEVAMVGVNQGKLAVKAFSVNFEMVADWAEQWRSTNTNNRILQRAFNI